MVFLKYKISEAMTKTNLETLIELNNLEEYRRNRLEDKLSKRVSW